MSWHTHLLEPEDRDFIYSERQQRITAAMTKINSCMSHQLLEVSGTALTESPEALHSSRRKSRKAHFSAPSSVRYPFGANIFLFLPFPES